jgi:uncharacterized membrane protein
MTDLYYYVLSVIILGAGGGGLYWYLRTLHAKRPITKTGKVFNTLPSEDISPPLAARMVRADKANGWQLVMAMLMDLARRSVLRFEERRQRALIGMTTEYYVIRQTKLVELTELEQTMLHMTFGYGEDGMDEIASLSKMENRFRKKSNKFLLVIDEDLRQRGLMQAERIRIRQRMVYAGYVLVIGSFLFSFMPSAIASSGAFFIFTTSLFILGAAIMLSSRYIPVLTEQGEQEAVHWQGFMAYIKDVAEGKQTPVESDRLTFEHYISFAIAFDIGAQWINFFSEKSKIPMPDWFPPMTESGGTWFSSVTSSFGGKRRSNDRQNDE